MQPVFTQTGCEEMEEKTIAAIATAEGAGGIGVIRISGKKAKQIADRVFRPVSQKRWKNSAGYAAHYGKIVDAEEEIDEAIALVFCSPKSYTGEDVVELSCHGGMYLTKRTLRAVLHAGASLAEPGEFTKRAFLNGKIGLTQAESVMDLIAAKGKQAARAALYQRQGALFHRIESIKQSLLSSAAHLSAWADYPEEEIEHVETAHLLESLDQSHGELESLLKSYDSGIAIKEGLETIIVGRPNVGKSTLMNLLSGCERSIVTEIPGTTRDIIEETILLGDITLRLSDTAGIRQTEDPIEQIGVMKAKDKMQTSHLVLAVFDASNDLTEDDKELIEELRDIPAVAIINKTDLHNKIDLKYIKDKIKHTVMISAQLGEGIEALTKAIAEITKTDRFDPSVGILANERQRAAAMEAKKCVEEARNALLSGMTLDAVTVSIEGAIAELLSLTGERVNEAVVDEVFSKFCVGK